MEHDEATFGSDGRYTCTDYLYLYELLLDQEHELLTSISKNNASEPGLLPSEWSTSAQNGIESALLAKDVVTYTKIPFKPYTLLQKEIQRENPHSFPFFSIFTLEWSIQEAESPTFETCFSSLLAGDFC